MTGLGQSRERFEAEQSEIVDQLREEIKSRDKQLQNYRKEQGRLELFFDDIKRQIEPLAAIPQIYKPEKTEQNICASVMRISDTHTGEIQDPGEIENVNAYNHRIMVERSIEYAKSHVQLVERMRMSYPINNCHVLVTGDLVSGDIHDNLKVTNEFPLPVQVVKAEEAISLQIAAIAPYFKRVIVEFVTEDNHGRLTNKPQSKEAGKNNVNYIIAENLKVRLERHENVEVNIYPYLEQIVSVLSRNYLICHGHHIRSWMGIPFYGIQRYVGKRSVRALQAILNELQSEHKDIIERARKMGFHKIVMGHYHHHFESEMFSICPSLSGANAFDQQNGNYSPAGSLSWLVHPERGEFGHVRFDLSHII